MNAEQMEDLDLDRIKRSLLAVAAESSFISELLGNIAAFVVQEKRRSFQFGFDKKVEIEKRGEMREAPQARKAYFYIDAGVVCGVCASKMHGSDKLNLSGPDGVTPWKQEFRCINPPCEQYSVPLVITPWEVEVAQK